MRASMVRIAGLVAAACCAAGAGQRPAPAVAPANLSGAWTLNRQLSEFPKDVGFGMDVVPRSQGAGETATDAAGSNPRALTARPLSEAEARNLRQLLEEVRQPSERLTINQAPDRVAIADAASRVRTFRPTGRAEGVALDAGPVPTITRWEGAQLVVRYQVEQGREIRYTYSRRDNPAQLVVRTQLVERGGRDAVTRVYEPSKPEDLPALPSERTRPQPASGSVPSGAATGAAPAAPAPPAPPDRVPAVAPRPAGAEPLDQRPDAELIGLTRLGVVIEGLGADAAKCGLRETAIDAAVQKSLAAGGLTVARNDDEDSYLYVHVVTSATSTGYCVSRYDANLYTHTTATLSYGTKPVLVRVALLDKGGVSGGGASSHAEAVVQALAGYVDQFVARIRAANR